MISSPATREQNHENVCVVGVTGVENNEEACDGSEDQDQNCEKITERMDILNKPMKNKSRGQKKNK